MYVIFDAYFSSLGKNTVCTHTHTYIPTIFGHTWIVNNTQTHSHTYVPLLTPFSETYKYIDVFIQVHSLENGIDTFSTWPVRTVWS